MAQKKGGDAVDNKVKKFDTHEGTAKCATCTCEYTYTFSNLNGSDGFKRALGAFKKGNMALVPGRQYTVTIHQQINPKSGAVEDSAYSFH